MGFETATTLRIGKWCVNPSTGQILRNGESARVEVRTMRLLVCLAEHAGEVVSIDDLLERVWPDVTVTPDSVYQAVASLRRLLGDDPKRPQYIETVTRLGYRMVAQVSPWADPEQETKAHSEEAANASPRNGGTTQDVNSGTGMKKTVLLWGSGLVALILIGIVVWAFVDHSKAGKPTAAASPAPELSPQKSIAVLPILDLTEGMHNEEFADGMTEELIDKLSKISGLQVPSATASFFYKDKTVPVAEIAKSLGVAYVLDGSVRKAGKRVRVAARLVRADNGYVVWSESYDRPFTDILMVQDDIAGEVTKALSTSRAFKPN